MQRNCNIKTRSTVKNSRFFRRSYLIGISLKEFTEFASFIKKLKYMDPQWRDVSVHFTSQGNEK
jgi:hypothetical protein